MGPQEGGKWSPSWTQIGPKSKTEKKMRKETLQNRLGEVLEPSWNDLGPSWPNLRPSWDDLEAARGRQNHCFSLGFSILFETYTFRTKMVILAGLGAILGPLGPNLGPLGPNLDRFRRPRGPKRDAKRDPEGAQEESKMFSFFLSIFGLIWDRFWTPKGGGVPRIWATGMRPGPGTLARLYVYIIYGLLPSALIIFPDNSCRRLWPVSATPLVTIGGLSTFCGSCAIGFFCVLYD